MEERLKRTLAIACNFNGNCRMTRMDYALFTILWAVIDFAIVLAAGLFLGVTPPDGAANLLYALPILPAYIGPYWCLILGRIRDCNFPKWASEAVDSDDWKKWAGPVILFNILDRLYIGTIFALFMPSRKDEGGRNEPLEPNSRAVSALLAIGTIVYVLVII